MPRCKIIKVTLEQVPKPKAKTASITKRAALIKKKEERMSRRRTNMNSLAADLILLATLRKWKPSNLR